MATGPSLIPLSELDSAFQLQEHLKALHYECSRAANNAATGPISRADAALIATPPDGVDPALWLYELCRFLINKCNDLVVGFLFDTPPCSAATCPEMRASEWQFLCAVHETPKTCCAIDYCCHTLDWATNIVTSLKIFPSRLSLGAGDSPADKSTGMNYLTNIFRRLHRIFAHAWFQHRQVYWSVENSTGLYTLFKIVSDTYELLAVENFKLPPEAEGLEPIEDPKPTISILKANTASELSLPTDDGLADGVSTRNNTRRHIRQSPSVGSAVATVLEADEDDDAAMQTLEDFRAQKQEIEAEPPITLAHEDKPSDNVNGEAEKAGDVENEETSTDQIESGLQPQMPDIEILQVTPGEDSEPPEETTIKGEDRDQHGTHETENIEN